METPGTFARFRLIHESAEQRRTPPGGPLARVYEVVSGATLEGPCVDDAVVVATTDLLLEGHRMAISRTAQCQDGQFVLRVSQPSETWQVGDATYAVSLSQVREGARIPTGR